MTLGDGTTIATDGFVITTGAVARTLDAARHLNGVHTLRTLGDAVSPEQDLAAGPSSVAVIGAGFIGARMGAVRGELHAENDVRLLTGVPVAEFPGACRVTGVRLAEDGRSAPISSSPEWGRGPPSTG